MLDTHQLPFHRRLESWLIGLGLGLIILGIGGGWVFVESHADRFYPGIVINDTQVGGLTKLEAYNLLAGKTTPPGEFQVQVNVDSIVLASSSAELGLHYDYENTLNVGLEYGKTGPLIRRLKQLAKLPTTPVKLQTPLLFDQEKATQFLTQLQHKVDTPGVEAAAKLSVSGAPTLKITPGQMGRAVELNSTLTQLQTQAGLADISLAASVASTGAQLSPDQIKAATDRATKLVGKQIVFTHPDITLSLRDQDLVTFLLFPDGINRPAVEAQVSEWQGKVTREPQDAAFEFDSDTLEVRRFTPPRNGLQLNTVDIVDQVAQALIELEVDEKTTKVEKNLPLAVKPPSKTLESTNQLGIKERIGFGDSEYDHSIPTRIHNVALTTTRITDTIIKPGEEFSFNKTLGDVSAATGYQPAYVIKNGQTVLGDGGGVCQVSTTLFRAVLNAGLPVTKRKAHSYRVSYYELNQKPGLDATVYSGDVDLRFINDTGAHVLIHAEADSRDLYMKVELYGTSDGRTTEIVDHKTWDPRPAPPAVYIPDPSLPTGKTKQVDWATSGIKASFKHIVRDKNGQVISEKEYYSNYIPWSAKYLIGP
jgi:vancomycin resistance protein YoaR